MFSPLLVYAVAFLLPVSAQQHDGQLPQITHAPNTMTTIPHREPSYSNLARPASLLVALEEHELRARSPSEIAAKVLHKRACHNVADVDCGNGYCCSAAQECEVTNGVTQCRLGGNSFFSASSAHRASETATGGATKTDGQSMTTTQRNPDTESATSAANGLPSSEYPHGLGGGAIAGIIICIVVAALLVAALVWWQKKRRSENRGSGAYAPANTKSDTPSNPNHGQAPTDIYGGSNYGKGGVAGPPPPEYLNELDSRETQRRPEMEAGTDAIPPREMSTMTPVAVSKPNAAELPTTNGRAVAELPP